MRIRTSLLLALGVAVLGAGLRAAIPVAKVDEPFRDVIRFYESMDRPHTP